MAQKACKKFLLLILSIPLMWGLARSSNAQDVQWRPYPQYGQPQQGFGQPQQGFGQPQQGFGQPQQGFGQPQCLNGRCRHRPAPPVARPDAQPQRPPASGTLPRFIVQTRSATTDRVKHGHASAIKFEGKFYIVSCAHVWGPGWDHSIIANGQAYEVKILGTSALDDLAVLTCPGGLGYINLANANARVGTAVKLGPRPGVVKGYRGNEIIVKGYVKNGDSGGPIFNNTGLVGIITTYEYVTGTNPNNGDTSGPCAIRIANFIRGLAGPPSLHDHGDLLDKISKLEKQINNLPQGDCRELALKVQSLAGTIDTNKREINSNKQNIVNLDKSVKENTISLQRIAGAVESLQKEMISQNERIGNLDQKSRDAILRIQHLERSTTVLTEAINTASKGKLHFRLRVDQSGRVTGVESQ